MSLIRRGYQNNFLPQVGTIDALSLESLQGVRYDCGVFEKDKVSIHYDPMLLKIISWGENREQAKQRMLLSLSKLKIFGIINNRDFLYFIFSNENLFSDFYLTSSLLEYRETFLASQERVNDRDALFFLAAAVFYRDWLSWRPEQEAMGLKTGWSNVPLAKRLRRLTSLILFTS